MLPLSVNSTNAIWQPIAKPDRFHQNTGTGFTRIRTDGPVSRVWAFSRLGLIVWGPCRVGASRQAFVAPGNSPGSVRQTDCNGSAVPTRAQTAVLAYLSSSLTLHFLNVTYVCTRPRSKQSLWDNQIPSSLNPPPLDPRRAHHDPQARFQEIEMPHVTLRRDSLASPKARFTVTVTIAVTVVLIGFGSASDVHAQYCTPDQCDECSLQQTRLKCCYEPPELWIVNTRCAPRCHDLDAGFEKIRYRRYDANCGRFVTETRASFLAGEASMPTLFFAHGNLLDHQAAMEAFWRLYHRLRCCPGPKRLVGWSWPAERVSKGLRIRKAFLQDLRIKLTYSEYQGYYLAKLVQQMSLTQRVMLAGHSYGAVISSTAAHWLAGGQLRGLTLAGGKPVEHANLRLALVSGAFDNDALLPDGRYGQALVAVEKVLVTRNARDSSLKSWWKASYRGRPALGFTGLNANRLGPDRDKLCQITMTPDVGKSHFLTPHLKSNRLIAALCCLAFPQCPSCAQQLDETDVSALNPSSPEKHEPIKETLSMPLTSAAADALLESITGE